jgi:hypothetical protein
MVKGLVTIARPHNGLGPVFAKAREQKKRQIVGIWPYRLMKD